MGGTVRQLSGRDPDGRWILSVVAKRTYRIGTDGCRVASEQVPLVQEPVIDDGSGLMLADCDVFPYKLQTDVVVVGSAHNSSGLPRFTAAIRVGAVTRWVQVFGDRKATVAHDGKIIYSQPTIPASVPLSYQFSYGGRDVVAEAKHGNPHQALRRYLGPGVSDEAISAASPYVYPRNSSGRGYVIENDRQSIEAAELPNVEDPDDLLTPARLVVGDPRRWPMQPIPASLAWMRYGWFPRNAALGFVPDYDPQLSLAQAPEVRLGRGKVDLWKRRAPDEPATLRGISGASLSLRLPYLEGNEEIEAMNLHPARPHLRFRLPAERPRLWVDGRKGNLVETKPVVHTLLLELDQERVTVLWRGCAPALRPYREELATMPLGVSWR